MLRKPDSNTDKIKDSPKAAAARLIAFICHKQTSIESGINRKFVETENNLDTVVDAIEKGCTPYIKDAKSWSWGLIYWIVGSRDRVVESEDFLLSLKMNTEGSLFVLNLLYNVFNNKKGGWTDTSVNSNILWELLLLLNEYKATDPNPRDSVSLDNLQTIAENFIKQVDEKRELNERKLERERQNMERRIVANASLSESLILSNSQVDAPAIVKETRTSTLTNEMRQALREALMGGQLKAPQWKNGAIVVPERKRKPLVFRQAQEPKVVEEPVNVDAAPIPAPAAPPLPTTEMLAKYSRMYASNQKNEKAADAESRPHQPQLE